MGDPDKADPDLIFPIENFDNSDWGYTDGGVLDIDCNYLWVCDNLLDPSHVAWVHVTSFAGAGTDDEPLDVERPTARRGVSLDPRPAAFAYYAAIVKFEGDCDRSATLRDVRARYWPQTNPSTHLSAPGGPGKDPMDLTLINISYNFMTPINEDQTRYFWFQHRNTDPHDKAISDKMNAGARMAFEEDRAVLESGPQRHEKPDNALY